jgi:hypothetical protein
MIRRGFMRRMIRWSSQYAIRCDDSPSGDICWTPGFIILISRRETGGSGGEEGANLPAWTHNIEELAEFGYDLTVHTIYAHLCISD